MKDRGSREISSGRRSRGAESSRRSRGAESSRRSRGAESSLWYDYERTEDSQVRASSGHHENRASQGDHPVWNPRKHGFYNSSAPFGEHPSHVQTSDVGDASVAPWDDQGGHLISQDPHSSALPEQFAQPDLTDAPSNQLSPPAANWVGEDSDVTHQGYQTSPDGSLSWSHQDYGSSDTMSRVVYR